MYKIACCLILFCVPLWAAPPAELPQLGDRVLLQIQNYPYTQRQLEIYFLIQNIVALRLNHPEKVVVGSAQWPQVLEVYKNEMILLHESSRLGRFHPSERMVLELLADVLTAIDNQPESQKQSKRLDLSRTTIRKTITQILQIDNFKRSHVSTQSALIYQSEWFMELSSRYLHRFLYGSEKYYPIFPQVR